MDPLKTISAAHRQVRTANLDDTMRMQLRMTEEFTEDYMAQLTIDQAANPFKQLRSEFEIKWAAERSFNMSMNFGRMPQGKNYSLFPRLGYTENL